MKIHIRVGVHSSWVAWIRITDPMSFWIMVHQRNQWIHSGHGFIRSLSPGQTIATCHNIVGRNILRAFGHLVATCCVGMLRLFGRGFRCTVIWVISNHWSWPTTRTTFNGQLSFYKGPGPYMYYPRKCCGLESHWKNWLISVKQWKPMCTHTQENIPSTAYSDSELLTTV